MEFILSPFNHFHYQGDFEVGLTLLPDRSIAQLEQALAENGFQFESGHFEGNTEKEYYLIPRKDGVFTPFFVISNKDPKLNRYLGNVSENCAKVTAASFATTQEFAKLVGLGGQINFRSSSEEKPPFVSVTMEIEQSRAEEERVEVGELEMTFTAKRWDIRYR